MKTIRKTRIMVKGWLFRDLDDERWEEAIGLVGEEDGPVSIDGHNHYNPPSMVSVWGLDDFEDTYGFLPERGACELVEIEL